MQLQLAAQGGLILEELQELRAAAVAAAARVELAYNSSPLSAESAAACWSGVSHASNGGSKPRLLQLTWSVGDPFMAQLASFAAAPFICVFSPVRERPSVPPSLVHKVCPWRWVWA